MAGCHGVLDIKGSLIGDPLEIKMFEKSGWRIADRKAKSERIMENSSNPEQTLTILKTFDFVPTL
jgi:hypothetical protein